MTSRDQANEMLKKSITRFIALTEEECCNISKFFYPLRLDKKQHWINHGDVCSEIAFVVKGCIRTYYQKNDVERTGQFFFENSFILIMKAG